MSVTVGQTHQVLMGFRGGSALIEVTVVEICDKQYKVSYEDPEFETKEFAWIDKSRIKPEPGEIYE